MAKLVHEIWFAADCVPSCVLAGPGGVGARKLMAEAGPPRLLRRFVAEAHFEAMTFYNRILGRGPYESDFLAQDTAPNPDAWRDAQESGGVMADDVAPESEAEIPTLPGILEAGVLMGQQIRTISISIRIKQA